MYEMIELEDVERLVSEGALLIDVMSRKSYEESHLPGAVNISLKELDEEGTANLDRGRPVITYCFDYQ
ncbi:MAG: rhodanese-like domain-containing protein [Actinobacteria bacterium]|nr:rhodanese-like domain-containing protein [Actinomycetota bacterium]